MVYVHCAGSALYPGYPPGLCGAAPPQPDLPHRPPHQVPECQADQRGTYSGTVNSMGALLGGGGDHTMQALLETFISDGS